ncbi:unnamed protein product [Caenorhabditis bovis]|uniref:Uncharacterized protein n=1 Tax=Caenorhabditis bovis TaxID=2654633 RepID=A0A8S1EYM1_9PELO|nr:unnamed protein product [Caenorhabditis bovis]
MRSKEFRKKDHSTFISMSTISDKLPTDRNYYCPSAPPKPATVCGIIPVQKVAIFGISFNSICILSIFIYILVRLIQKSPSHYVRFIVAISLLMCLFLLFTALFVLGIFKSKWKLLLPYIIVDCVIFFAYMGAVIAATITIADEIREEINGEDRTYKVLDIILLRLALLLFGLLQVTFVYSFVMTLICEMGEPSAKRPRNADEYPNVLSMDENVKEKLMELDMVQLDLDNLGEQAAEEILAIEQAYNKKRQPHYQKRSQLIEQIPSFWQTAFLNHHLITTAIPEEEEEVLLNLKDLEVEEFEDIKTGYKIKLKFDKNSFFDTEQIIKTFHLNAENPVSTTSEINWKPGKKPEPKDPSDGSQLTFVEWLASNLPPDADEIAEVIKDDLYPNPLQYFIMPDMNEVNDEELEEFIDEEDQEDENVADPHP